MVDLPDDDGLVVRADPALARALEGLVPLRLVFIAGLPGTGKSFLIHQLAHLAGARGRLVHLLQWDVARPVFEATPTGRRYPQVDGVTHPLIRRAVGCWARQAVAAWDRRHPDPRHLLLGEVPLVGGRLVELARVARDDAEPLLAGPGCQFVIPVPSPAVRAVLEAERARRARTPLHPREREDAAPAVLRALWTELVAVARRLGLTGRDVAAAGPPGVPETPPWDPELYRRVCETVLRHRTVQVLRLETVLPTAGLSVYRFAAPPRDLVPGPEEAEAHLRAVEAAAPPPEQLAGEAAAWWVA